MESAAQTLMRK